MLTLSEAAFRLEDRSDADRFQPLAAQGASLTLADNMIRALATLRHHASGREVTDVAIAHNLSTGIGHADLAVQGLRFDQGLQPDQLTVRALGVIANARGTVTGTGRIDWNPDRVASSGEFSTDRLDFAAAFGPVRGASGTIRFDDLIGLTTAPGQRLRVASINPGIEVFDGEVEFALRDGTILSVAGGEWPFMGGRLILESVDLNLGIEEQRRYVFRIEGLEAAQFVQQMELGNISATGLFDGVVPIVFDAAGNGRIEGGALDSRAPGGNVSYVGELTYEDLTPIANFAFDALRSLDYRSMTLRMDGALTGEIVTRVRFDGVSQGEGASRNFVTRRLASLPIRFNVNVRAPFYQLITSIRAMYDPAFVRDPRELGLIGPDGAPEREVVNPPLPAIRPDDLIPDEPAIQTQESETMR
ncbi:YdbH domain-containing protein [Leptolyngbya sp. 15MV]|nr:YdbH domain-containing protein [Leptolyngbya sp. 15MV]